MVFFPFILIVFMVEAGVKTFSFCFFSSVRGGGWFMNQLVVSVVCFL